MFTCWLLTLDLVFMPRITGGFHHLFQQNNTYNWCANEIWIYNHGHHNVRAHFARMRMWRLFGCMVWAGRAKSGSLVTRTHEHPLRKWALTNIKNNKIPLEVAVYGCRRAVCWIHTKNENSLFVCAEWMWAHTINRQLPRHRRRRRCILPIFTL